LGPDRDVCCICKESAAKTRLEVAGTTRKTAESLGVRDLARRRCPLICSESATDAIVQSTADAHPANLQQMPILRHPFGQSGLATKDTMRMWLN
jgi:hypothetical protein